MSEPGAGPGPCARAARVGWWMRWDQPQTQVYAWLAVLRSACVSCLMNQSCTLIRSLPLAVLTRLPDFTAPDLPKRNEKDEKKGMRIRARACNVPHSITQHHAVWYFT